MSKTTLYRYFDKESQLLYVGITGSLSSRQSQHLKKSVWFYLVATASYEHYELRADALRAESQAIKTENPIHNIALNNRGPEHSSHFKDFQLKMHFYQMFQENDLNGKYFKFDDAHIDLSIELKSWVRMPVQEDNNLSLDQTVVKKLDELANTHNLGETRFRCITQCPYCVGLRNTEWFQATLDSVMAVEHDSVLS